MRTTLFITALVIVTHIISPSDQVGSSLCEVDSPIGDQRSGPGEPSSPLGRSKRECVVESYTKYIGVRELKDKNDGPEVEMFLSSVGLHKGHSWCGAFPNHVLQQCGTPTPKGAAWAPSWFPQSKIIYTKGTDYKKAPEPGDIFGIYYPNLKRVGHIGFCHKWNSGSSFTTVEGNTNSEGSREGNGVYKKWRLKSQVYKIADWIE